MKTDSLPCARWQVMLVTFLLGILSGHTTCNAQVLENTLVPAGSLWSYLDDGSDQGSGWRAPDFDDSGWGWGFAEFGFGEFDEETVVDPGPANNHFVTYYFRHSFRVTGAASYVSLDLGVLRDDGVVVYLNGTNIWRNNMPASSVTFRTVALTNVTGADERTFIRTPIAPGLLRNGVNVLAVEVHQASRTSADLSFDLDLTGVSVPPRIVRGPYLQTGSSSNVVVRWRTNVPCDSQVHFGTDADLGSIVTDNAITTEHEVRLDGLQPDWLYFYAVGTSDDILAGDDSFHFVTAPTNARPTRIWVIGDSGTANFNARSVYDAYRAFAGARHTDVWMMLGDNAYGIGTQEEYQAAVFDMYPELLRQTVLWSTIGNHETYSGTFADFPYLHIFTLPENGEAGGVPSGTERYYSFDYGNVHFVCLDAMTSDRSPGGPMCMWLQEDLQSHTADWVIAFWHHPPYTKGSHNSDVEGELIQMRENVVPILEAHGVDLVLSGHSHCYERSFLINGHYGSSPTFTETMKIDGGSGREDDTGAYRKSDVGPDANRGAVYVVAGSSGQVSGGTLDHPAMFYDALRLGSLVLDIDGLTLHAKFLRETGAIDDYFTILKGAAARALRLVDFQLESGSLRLRWNSRAGKSYVIERATSLHPPDWLAITDAMAGTGTPLSYAVPFADGVQGAFFRVRSLDVDPLSPAVQPGE